MENLKVAEIKSFVPARFVQAFLSNSASKLCLNSMISPIFVTAIMHSLFYKIFTNLRTVTITMHPAGGRRKKLVHQHVQNSNVMTEFEATVTEVVEQPCRA